MKFLVIFTLCVVFAAANAQSGKTFFCSSILNAQIKKEFDASQTYLTLATRYAHDSRALHGFSKMFEHNWKEEVEHGEKLMNYGTKRRVEVATPAVEAFRINNLDSLSICQIMDEVLNLEIAVNDHLLYLHACGRADKDELKAKTGSKLVKLSDKELNDLKEDPQLQDFVEGNYLDEQVESIKQFADLVTRLKRASNDCTQNLGIHMIDQELLQKYGK